MYVAFVAGMASYVDAAAISAFGAVLAILAPLLPLTPALVGLAAGMFAASIAIGAVVGGRLGDSFGRKPVFLCTMGLCGLAAVALIFTPPVPIFVAGASLLGFACGADLPVALAATSEVAPRTRRARLIVLSNLLWIGGILSTLLITTLLGKQSRLAVTILLGHVAFAAISTLALRVPIPESSRWVAAKERAGALHGARSSRAQMGLLLAPPYRRRFVGLIAFYAFTNLAANTSGQFGVYILSSVGGATVAEAARTVLFGIPVVICGLVVFMRLGDGPARFPLFQVGAVAGVLAPLTLAVLGVDTRTYTLSVLLAAVGVSFAFEGIMKVWTQESFPSLLRATAQGFIVAAGRLSAAAFAVITPAVVAANVSALYGILTTTQLVGLFVAWITFRRQPFGTAFEDENEGRRATI